MKMEPNQDLNGRNFSGNYSQLPITQKEDQNSNRLLSYFENGQRKIIKPHVYQYMFEDKIATNMHWQQKPVAVSSGYDKQDLILESIGDRKQTGELIRRSDNICNILRVKKS